MRDSFYERRLKRALDLAASAIGLLCLAPVLGAVAAAIKLSDPGPVFFLQTRVGRDAKPFRIIKFRTMRAGACGPLVTSGGDARVTALGRWLRKTKLDELPQLFNVLRGEMSIVGPRPEVPRYVELFKEEYRRILALRPGITDYAAIKYRDEEAALAAYADPEQAYATRVLPDKIRLYHQYLSRIGFRTDLEIVLATLQRVLGCHGH